MQYLSGVAAVGSSCEGGNGVADLAPLEKAEAAGGRRDRGGREGSDTEAEAEQAARAEVREVSGWVGERGGDDGGGETKHQGPGGEDARGRRPVV